MNKIYVVESRYFHDCQDIVPDQLYLYCDVCQLKCEVSTVVKLTISSLVEQHDQPSICSFTVASSRVLKLVDII